MILRNWFMAMMLILIPALVLSACRPTETDSESAKGTPSQQTTTPKGNEKDSTADSTLKEVVEKAENGMTLDSSFDIINSMIDHVKSAWGNPDKVDQVETIYYATYNTKNAVFGFKKDGEILDIRSYNPKLNAITLKEIKKALGEPVAVRDLETENIYVYPISGRFELKFIIPKNKSGVDHISLYNPQRAAAEPEVWDNKSDYYLEIKGTSRQLSAQSWRNMLAWRKQIVEFAKTQENVYINGMNKKMVALTFDDGPDPNITPAIIDILNQYDVVGNFFFIGSEAKKYPDVVRKANLGGHMVLSHSHHHVELTKLGSAEIAGEIEKAGEAIKSVIGKEPKYLRPPYGETNEQVASIAKKAGYSIVIWSIDTLDWSDKSAENIVKNVMENVRNGDIILMHSDSEKTETKKALPTIIEALHKQNYSIVDLETLLGKQ